MRRFVIAATAAFAMLSFACSPEQLPNAEEVRGTPIRSARPTYTDPAQELAAGKEQLREFAEQDRSLDSDQETRRYLQEVVDKLAAAQTVHAPFPLVAHYSTRRRRTARFSLDSYYRSRGTFRAISAALLGGQIIFFVDDIEGAKRECELAFEVGFFVNLEANRAPEKLVLVFEKNGGADALAADKKARAEATIGTIQAMYDAGWDPRCAVDFLNFRRQTVPSAQYGLPSVHPTAALESDISRLPRKAGLVRDSRRFRTLRVKWLHSGYGPGGR